MEWQTKMQDLHARATAMHETRELVLVHTRKLGQLAAKSIRSVHRHQFDQAFSLLAEATAAAREARNLLKAFPELNPAYLHDTEKELVEAAVVIAIVQDLPFPSPDELGAQVMSYLHGLGEAASEVRRFALDEMRAGRIGEATRILECMEAIYEELITFDFSDSLTNGLRRTCDALRAVIERTRSDLTMTASQHELVNALREARYGTQTKSDPDTYLRTNSAAAVIPESQEGISTV